MMKRAFVSIALSGLAAGLAIAGTAQAEPSSSSDSTTSEAAPRANHERIATTTLNLEKAFSDQFVKGEIDRDALAPLVRDVVQAMPEAQQPKVQAHIDAVIALGQQRASQMTPEERAHVAAPPVADTVDQLIVGYGWPGYAGWGGYGAFGFPYYGYGGLGYGTGLGYSAASYGASYGYGTGLGWGGGWGWGW